MNIQEEDAVMEQEDAEEKKGKKGGFLKEIILYALLFFLCIYAVPRYVAQRTVVNGPSMENTLFTGDNLLVEKLSYHFTSPKRFDVVVFYPYGKDVHEYYVKRVVGLPGETIQIKGKNIYINGKILEENYGKNPIESAGIAQEPITLGKDEFFVMGDNRRVSLDSRSEEVGPVHKNLITGKVVLRIYPFKDFGPIKK